MALTIKADVTVEQVNAANNEARELLTSVSKAQDTIKFSSKRVFELFIPIFGMNPNYKKGGAPNIQEFCAKVYESVFADSRLQDEKGKFRPYSVASAQHKDPSANSIKALAVWIKDNQTDLFSVKVMETVTDKVTGETKEVEVIKPQFEQIAAEKEEKDIKNVLNHIAGIYESALITESEKAVLKGIFDVISARLSPVLSADIETRKAKVLELQKRNTLASEEEETLTAEELAAKIKDLEGKGIKVEEAKVEMVSNG